MIIQYTFPACWLFVDEPGEFLHTAFPDGARLESVVMPERDLKTARRYGYGDNVRALWREHDLLHHAIGTLFGHGCSPTIWAVAHPGDPTGLERHHQRGEERFVGLVHRWLNLNEWHEELGVLETFGRSREELADELRALCRGDLTTFLPEPNFAHSLAALL